MATTKGTRRAKGSNKIGWAQLAKQPAEYVNENETPGRFN